MFSGATATLLIRASTLGTRIFSFLLLAAFVPPDLYGALILALTIAEVVRVFADFGVDTVSIRSYAQANSSNLQTFLNEVFTFKLISGLAAYLLATLTVALVSNKLGVADVMLLGLLAVTPGAINFSVNPWIALNRAEKLATEVVLLSSTAVLLVVWLVVTTSHWEYPVAVILIYEAAIGFFGLTKLKQLGWTPHLAPLATIAATLRPSVHAGITQLAAMTYTRLDMLVLGLLVTAAPLGAYGLAVRIFDPLLFVASAYAVTLYGRLSSHYVNSGPRSSEDQTILLVGLHAAGAAMAFAIAATVLIPVFAPQYRLAISFVWLLIPVSTFRAVNLAQTAVIHAYGAYSTISRIAIWNLGLSFTAFVALVPSLGIRGAVLTAFGMEVLNAKIQYRARSRLLRAATPEATA